MVLSDLLSSTRAPKHGHCSYVWHRVAEEEISSHVYTSVVHRFALCSEINRKMLLKSGVSEL